MTIKRNNHLDSTITIIMIRKHIEKKYTDKMDQLIPHVIKDNENAKKYITQLASTVLKLTTNKTTVPHSI